MKERNNDNNAALQERQQRDAGAVPHRSKYEGLTLTPHENNYGVVRANNYGSLASANNYSNPSSPPEYEHGDLAKFIE